MASDAFSDMRTLLFAAPVVSSTCTLLFARDQDFFLSLFTDKNVPAPYQGSINTILPDHFKRFFYKGVYGLVGFLSVTAWLSSASAYNLGRKHAAFRWYVGAASLAIGHVAYVPWVAPKVKAIFESSSVEKEGNDHDATGLLREWLGLNALRMWTTDLGAWACCLVAVMKTLAPRD